MARNVSHPRPLSADFEPPPKSPSMLYSILPSAVQSRLPRLPSLRKSTMYGLPSRRKTCASAPGSGSRTPEAGYGNAMVLSGMGDEELYFGEGMSSDEDLTAHSRERNGTQMMLDENKSGIGWKFANQGLNLLSLAVEESSTISQDPRFGNPSFARQLYIHALTYLLRALPADLTTEEQLSIRSALPTGVVEPLRLEINPTFPHPPTSTQPSLLQRTLAVQLFILFQFVLPYLKYLLSTAYQYEREHKISEKILSQGIETVDGLGKRGVGVAGMLFGMGDGRVGQVIGEATTWFVEGVTGGIHEGVGEGMAIMGVKRPVSEGVRS